MADSEEFRLKRLKHEEHMSRVFDEVMGLGDFADSSRGSVSSSKSEEKGPEETSGPGENRPMEEDNNGSKPEEKREERVGESPKQVSVINVGTRDGEEGGSGGSVSDDAVDGLPVYGPEEEKVEDEEEVEKVEEEEKEEVEKEDEEEEEEDWHFALPMGSLEDADVGKAKAKGGQTEPGTSVTPEKASVSKPGGGEEEEQKEEERGKEGSGESANTSHSSQEENPPQESRGEDGVQNQMEETEESRPGERSEGAPVEESPPPPPPPPAPSIKEEPLDEGYDAALIPQSSIRQIKEELEQQEEELRISSVYSVGGGGTFTSPSMPTAVQLQAPTAFFIPSRGAVLQAVAPLPVRPPAVVPATVVPATVHSLAPRPPPPAVPGSVRCSGCSKVLLKGQTAFQRKGSTQLFCSTVCLTGHLPPANKNRACFQCHREIFQPRDMITIPGDDNTIMYFCGQFCLSVFRHKRKQVDNVPDKRTDKRLETKPEKPPEKQLEPMPDKPVCSVCKVTNKQIEHEVTHQGRLHRLCSDACFATWRKLRQLAMNCCEGCGLYCSSSSGSCQTLSVDRSQLNFCSPTCIATYKQTCRKNTECPNCQKTSAVSSTIMERDQKGKIQLYCSAACVEQSRPPQHNLTGTPFPCSLCKVSAVPQYHLAMVDGTIRNFCSYGCVSTYRRAGYVSQPELTNGSSPVRDSAPPVPQDSAPCPPGHLRSQTSVPPLVPAYAPPPGPAHAVDQPGGAGDAPKLTCQQCSAPFSSKPLLLSHQERIVVLCSRSCSELFRTQKNVVAVCEFCKQEKVLHETISYDQQELSFCSEGCQQQFKQEVVSRQPEQVWLPCSFCCGFALRTLSSHYGGKVEEFCRPHCMSQFTVLYYGMGRCEGCRRQGVLPERLHFSGSVRCFCSSRCLLQYCCLHFQPAVANGNGAAANGNGAGANGNGTGAAPQTPSAPAQPHHSSKMTPVIADVVSLVNGSAATPNVSAATALTGALPTSNVDGKNLDHASTQTDATGLPSPRRRQMKNKSILCRPLTADQGVSCQLPAALPDGPRLGPGENPEDLRSANGVPARLTGRHFPGKRETGSECRVCCRRKRKKEEEEEEEGAGPKRPRTEGAEPPGGGATPLREEGEEEEEQKAKTQTLFFCKTCSGEPSLCPVPCFEIYHTRLIYRAPDGEAS